MPLKQCPIILGVQALEDLVNLKLPPITLEVLETKGSWQQEVKIFKRSEGLNLQIYLCLGLAGAGAGGLVGSQVGGGGFSKPVGSSSNPIGGGGFVKPGSTSSMNMNTPIGGGGFVQPKPPANNFGGGFSNTQKVNTVGSNFGSNFGSNTANQGFGQPAIWFPSPRPPAKHNTQFTADTQLRDRI